MKIVTVGSASSPQEITIRNIGSPPVTVVGITAALFTGTALGLATMLVVWFAAGEKERGAVIGGTLLNMAVFGAMISYAMQGLSFILLRRNLPHIVRPYRSPVGSAGAAVAIVIALVTLYCQLGDPVYRKGVYAVAVFYALGLAYFAAFGRHRLILSPEEEFAMSKGSRYT